MGPRERRFEHGFWWGATASAASAVIVLLVMALGLWPGGQPLGVQAIQMLGRDYLGLAGEGPLWAAYLVAGASQLLYGALCGGLLAMVTERVTMSNALAFGALRWFNTQVVVLPALGFGDFGWLYGWSALLLTALPHLAYAVSLGWLMRAEDEGREPIPLHIRNGHLVWAQQGRG